MTDTTDPAPSIATVSLLPDGTLAIRVDPSPIMDRFGIDPGNLAPVIAAVLEQLCRAACEILTDDDGNHPEVADLRERVLEAFPGAVEHYASDNPVPYDADGEVH